MALDVGEMLLCPQEIVPDTSLIQFRVAAWASLDVLPKKKPLLCWESNPGHTFHNTLLYSLNLPDPNMYTACEKAYILMTVIGFLIFKVTNIAGFCNPNRLCINVLYLL